MTKTIERLIAECRAEAQGGKPSDKTWWTPSAWLTWFADRLEATLGDGPTQSSGVSPPDDVTRCSICGWTLADSVETGCVRGNCSMRPLPERAYAPERANVEYAGALAGRYGIPAAPVISEGHPQRVIATDTVTGVQRERLLSPSLPTGWHRARYTCGCTWIDAHPAPAVCPAHMNHERQNG